MSTINNKHSIYELITNDGHYTGDPQVAFIFSYMNQFGNETHKVFWPKPELNELLQEFYKSPFCSNIKLLWAKDTGITPAGQEWLEEYKK